MFSSFETTQTLLEFSCHSMLFIIFMIITTFISQKIADRSNASSIPTDGGQFQPSLFVVFS
jgi:hypothetical protein